jgi:ketosteroid isomerase-like protein
VRRADVTVELSRNKRVVERYLEGLRRSDHEQILSCLTDDIVWTVFGAFRLQGKEAYDAAIEGPGFVVSPELHVVRMVEEGDTVMAELTGTALRPDGTKMRMAMGEVFVFHDGLIFERRAFVIPLEVDDVR